MAGVTVLDVELLHVADCPGHQALLPRLRALLDDAGVATSLTVTEVHDDADAVRRGFLGSPTVRVAGVDVDPSPPVAVGLQCRLYVTADGLRDTPPEEWVWAALRAANARTSLG